MPPDPPRRVRPATDVEQETLRALGIIARELGNLNRRAEEILDRLPQRDSKTEFSIRPGHARLTFWNVNAWTIVSVVALIAFGTVAYVWVSQH